VRVFAFVVLLGARSLPAQEAEADTMPAKYRDRFIGLPYMSYSPQTKLAFGVAGGYQFKWPGMGRDSRTSPSYLAVNATYTQKGQWVGFVGTSLFTPRNRWWTTAAVSAGYFPVFYFGVGPRTAVADTNLMQNRFRSADLRLLRQVASRFFVGPNLRLLSVSHLKWQFPARIPASLEGGRGGTNVGIGAAAIYDGRNSSSTPTRGRYAQVEFLVHDPAWGSDFSYLKVIADGRVYLPVRHGRDVLALTAYGEFSGSDVPIQTMAMLGSATTQVIMRGVYLGRFRDRHSLVAQADYRGHLKGRFGYVVFGSGGNVFGGPGNGFFDRVKFTYGTGLRFNVNPADPLNLRADFTLTSFGGGGLSLGATEAF
jgi:outer membrane protein assembly factor BamA